MSTGIEILTSGGITSPKGFFAGASYAGIKKETRDVLDLGVLYSELSCVAAGMFTTNKIKAAPVLLDQRKLRHTGGKARAIIVNSGCANACTGEQGMKNAMLMADNGAKRLGIDSAETLVSSTGVIGVQLPIGKIDTGLGSLVLSAEGGHEFARAIMTTDTRPKEIAVRVTSEQGEYTIGGTAKGAGMIHPNMATMLSFIASDARVDNRFLQLSLRKAVDATFNMISVDGDTSTNDTVLVLANGLAGSKEITQGSGLEDQFQKALTHVCMYLAKNIAGDGEGATRLIEVTVNGASTAGDARIAARTIASSPLVKAAVHGCDPNWGRVVAAAGRSGASMEQERTDVYIGSMCLFKSGLPLEFDKKTASSLLDCDEVRIRVELNIGSACAVAWGCDLSEEYVVINSEYTT